MRHKIHHRVVVAVDLARPDGQRKLTGLMHYLASHNVHWDLRLKRTAAECTVRQVADFPHWDIDGIIYAQSQVDPSARKALDLLTRLDIPLVVLDPGDNAALENRTDGLAIVRTDPDSIGETAAQCFLAQGACRSYGYVPSVQDCDWSRRRGKTFATALQKHGAECRTFRPVKMGCNDFAELRSWLAELPKPAGILAAYDDRALTVLEACSAEGLAIPRDVSVLSVDDDALVCENCTPTLSSIRPDQERSGYVAGELLAGLMRRRDKRLTRILPVKAVVHRNSTLPANGAGRLVQKALAYIRQNARLAPRPDDVVRYLGVSRPLLDLRFRELLGTSVGKTIESERLKLVCTALLESHATIKEIADTCGFKDSFQLMHVFKRRFGITASAYRRQSPPSATSPSMRRF